jgi:large subunit ribosomal protein L5
MPRLKELYQNEAVAALQREFGYKNPMQVPRLQKIVVNIGMGEALQNAKSLETATADLVQIVGQKPVTTKARKSIAGFKLREGNTIGVMVTLRGDRMWDFLDRLCNIALPRQRDFRGVSPDSFDGRGNYSLGLREQLIFPEIDYDKVDKVRGMSLTFVTTAKTDEEARSLLRLLGMPFSRRGGAAA